MRYFCFSLALLLVGSLSAPRLKAEERVEYNRDIRPILSDNCFQCHGPDEESRAVDMRLDLRESAIANIGDLAPIKPGDAEHSSVLLRVTESDPDLRMPPAETKKQLTPEEIELLRKWIDQGAEYQEHWAFLPIRDDEPPIVEHPGVDHPIDRFIVRKLEQQGLSPAPAAEPETVIRRLYLDLIGLLPEPERVDAFLSAWEENREKVIDELVDELLASKHYGERWGRHWLDQARYADSHGYTIDSARNMWPYRDWVINALNDDMPFDQFTIEQLAGDLLPEPTKSQQVATGFHRNTLINQEGGTDDEQFRNEEVVDRVNTTGAVWLGLTVACAQCHTHKFDPITHREYFQLFDFFNHTADVNNDGPTVKVSAGEMLLDDVDPERLEEIALAERQLEELNQSQASRQIKWEQSLLESSASQPVTEWTPIEPTDAQGLSETKFTTLDDGSQLIETQTARDVYTLTYAAPTAPIAALRLRVLPHESLPQQGPGLASNGNFVLTSIEFLQNGKPMGVTLAQADHSQPDYPISDAVNGKPDSGWAINIGNGSAPGAKMNAAHEAHFTLEEPLLPANGPVTIIMRHELNDTYNIGRFAFDVSPTAPAPLSDESLLQLVRTPADKRSDEQKKQLATKFADHDVELAEARRKLAGLKRDLGLGKEVNAMVMQEIAQPRETYIHIRGDFTRKDKKTGLLFSDTPAVFPPLEKTGERANRLDLARWLVSDDNPLTARVTVNRIWMRYFGEGLVKTENDFGTQGSYPTHPELLDWLAHYFMESGWSMKKLHKLIVTSETYLQSSWNQEELEAVDPLNQLLGRQNRIRLDAEILRDVSLSASGLLNSEIGGPSVHPPQPEGVYSFTQSKKDWTADTDGDRYRRGMYTFFYRSAPYPFLTTFNMPDMQSVCTRRVRSNTPLQSLTMANDASIFELAQGLALRVLSEVKGEDDSARRERVVRLYRLCYARPPSADEVERVLAFEARQRELFTAEPEAAKAVINEQLAEITSTENAAAWTAVARAIMNTDEFLTRE